MTAKGKGIELVNKADGIPDVMLDTHLFRQVLSNLVGNAVKFTERGSVTVSASYRGSNLEFSVSDTGCGIAPDLLPRIFNPFVQAQDPSHSAYKSGGTGLGLSICRRLVELMGGELVVESEPGKGSRFRVCIPSVVSASEKAKAPAESPKFAVPANCALPKHVLVVDDSPVNRAVLSAHLKKARVAAIDQASDGVEALEKLDSAFKEGVPYDFVFTDYWMPNMNGIELIEKIRADSRFGNLPVFAVTADTEFKGNAKSNLFDGAILKPLTYDKLIEAFSRKRG
jgi:CheY-like chemotaxis protein/anti-sigma regulatory factor (Ser/Thr protein kinase)